MTPFAVFTGYLLSGWKLDFPTTYCRIGNCTRNSAQLEQRYLIPTFSSAAHGCSAGYSHPTISGREEEMPGGTVSTAHRISLVSSQGLTATFPAYYRPFPAFEFGTRLANQCLPVHVQYQPRDVSWPLLCEQVSYLRWRCSILHACMVSPFPSPGSRPAGHASRYQSVATRAVQNVHPHSLTVVTAC